jgi:hypothetical protein
VDRQVPTWRSVYHGNFTNLSPIHGLEHIMEVRINQSFSCSFDFNILTAEIPMVFGNFNISIPSSAREVEVSQYMQGNPFVNAQYCLD